jgi:prophage maintenance system killer protein
MTGTPPIAERLQTLTLQDLIWLNLVASRRVNAFDYAKLEEAAFRQFGYGGRQDVVGQAASLLEGLIRLRPFAEDNESTALPACGAFLALNGFALRASSEQARDLVSAVKSGSAGVRDALAKVAEPNADRRPASKADLQRVVEALMAESNHAA